jgi:hypothetical protein
MNRLLLRSYPDAFSNSRVEVFFQYVQYLQLPSKFADLGIKKLKPTDPVHRAATDTIKSFPVCCAFELSGSAGFTGVVVASECMIWEDLVPNEADSAFFMM